MMTVLHEDFCIEHCLQMSFLHFARSYWATTSGES